MAKVCGCAICLMLLRDYLREVRGGEPVETPAPTPITVTPEPRRLGYDLTMVAR